MLTKIGGLANLQQHSEGAKVDTMVDIRATVTELERLLSLDPSLVEEKTFVNDLAVGIDTGMRSGQVDTTAVWVHDKLMSATEEGQKTDRAKIVKELSSISKFITGPKSRASVTTPWGPPPVQPMALAQHFGSYGSPPAWPPAHGYGMPPYASHGVPGQYGPQRGHGGGGRDNGGARKPAMCKTCRKAGKGGADIMHSYKVCPLVQCRKCNAYGHVSRNCPG